MRIRGTVWLLLVLLATAFRAEASPSGPFPPAAVPMQLNVSGTSRTYWLYVPAGTGREGRVPLLMVLHGSAGSGEDMMAVTQRGFERLADREKFVVVYPDALERRWNEQDGAADDAGFLLAVADKLAAEGLVDRRKVFMAGISNGGMMAQRVACESADRLAGIALVAGSMPEALAAICKPSRPLPVLIIHGTEDPIVPWNGGAVAGFEDFGKVLSAGDTARFWSQGNLCRGGVNTIQEPDRDPRDGTRVNRGTVSGCPARAAVMLVTVEGGGHTWPGGHQYLPERFIGRTSREFDANRMIWDFFQASLAP